ncbi:MAG: hypothetical protein IIW17_02985 [Clostridia bacterium]|nr:hypothetical protein [Clostridia bacterium]
MKAPAWQRPKTTKVYLHRPLSERVAVLCPDFKLLTLSLLDNGVHVGQPGVGLLFLHGKDMVGFDPKDTRFREIEYGLPIYEVIADAEVQVRVEAFAGEERNPTVYFCVTLQNNAAEHAHGSIGLLPRSGQEKYMVNQHQEGYSPYCPNEKNWYMLKRTWRQLSDHTAGSDMGYLTLCPEGLEARFVTDSPSGHSFAPADYFEVRYSLDAGKSLRFTGAIRAKEQPPTFDYDQKRAECVEFWRTMGDKIRYLPDTDDARYLGIYRHMVMQCTQMLSRYEGQETITVRQGDVARFVWPYEGAQVLVNLERAGITEYSADAYRGYFDRWLVRTGEDAGKIGSNAGWENFTGSVTWGLSEHLLNVNDPTKAAEFLPYLVMMRDWIKRKRNSPREVGYPNIFPCGKGSDWSEQGQFWTFTDSHNCMALRSMCKALKKYNFAEYDATKAELDDYSRAIISIRDALFDGHEHDEAYILPHMLGIPFEDSENYSYYTDGAPYLLYTGFIEPGSTIMQKMEAFFRLRGQFEKGLTGRMTSCASMWDEAYFGGYGDVWYTMQSETYWIRAWCASGQRAKALESLEACLTYGLSRECIAAERYCSINPWYNPWQPNGSGSSRVIEMMQTYFGVKPV